MAKTNTIFICQECGHQVPKWLGKCPECDSWNSFAEERKTQPTGSKSRHKPESPAPFPITQVQTDTEYRLTTGIGEFDRVLGGGIVGPSAGDLIAEVALAVEMGADAVDVSRAIHPHPTLSETVAFAAEAFDGTLTDLYIPKTNR